MTRASHSGATTDATRTRRLLARLQHLPARLGWGHSGYCVNDRKAMFVLLALLALPFINDMLIVARLGFEHAYFDFGIFYRAAQTFDHDPTGHIYAERPNYLYPPFYLTLLRPLLPLPPRLALAVFQIVKWIALVIALRSAWRLCAPSGESVPPIVALGSVALVWRYFANEMINGNINMLLLACVLGGALLALRGRHLTAGFIVAVAASVKVTPVLLLAYFVYKGWWRTLIGAAVALVLCLLLWPALFIGWSENLRLLGEWYQHIISGYVAHGDVNSTGTNQGLTAVLNRLFGNAVAIEPSTYVTVWRLPDGLRTGLRFGLSAAVLATLLWTCRGRFAAQTPALARAAEIGLVQIAMLVLSGYTWKAHYIAMLLPNAVLLAYLADMRYSRDIRKTVVWLLVASLVFMTLSAEIFGPHVADLLLSCGVVLYSGILAAAALILARARLRRDAETGKDPAPRIPAHPSDSA